jgi:hypothetical protein
MMGKKSDENSLALNETVGENCFSAILKMKIFSNFLIGE